MVKRYYEKDVKIQRKTVDIFECPDCGFEFNAEHEVDEQVGGWECPLCEVFEQESAIEQLNKIKKLSNAEDMTIVDFAKEVLTIIEGREKPTRKLRS